MAGTRTEADPIAGNIIYSIGSIIVAAAAQVRSFKLMIGGRVILALGDIATQVAQYKVFSSWFSPNNGFASTLGIELGIKKIGGFVGKSSANIIAKNTGNFAWVFWISVFMNVFTNVLTLVFYWFNGIAHKKFGNVKDPATGEKLTEKSKKFQPKKVLELPWVFWAIIAFSLFQTSTAVVFTQNATELAEKRFNTDSITAGWYSATLQYAGFFLVPCIGAFIDILGNRITLRKFSKSLAVGVRHFLNDFSRNLRYRCLSGHGSCQLGYRHEGNCCCFWDLRCRFHAWPDHDHRQHPHFHVARLNFRLCLRG